jgi:hypothetical protein
MCVHLVVLSAGVAQSGSELQICAVDRFMVILRRGHSLCTWAVSDGALSTTCPALRASWRRIGDGQAAVARREKRGD